MAIKYVSPVEFHVAVDRAKKVFSARVYAGLTRYTPREYAAMRTFLGPLGRCGYAITGDGELVNLFSWQRGNGGAIIADAVHNGARHLNCYDGPLTRIYADNGFVEVRREAFDPSKAGHYPWGHPDVVYMEYRANG